MIIKAFDNGIVSGDTLRVFRKVKKLLKPRSNARDRVLSSGEFKSLIEFLPPHTRAIVFMGYFTGMRKSEILNLTWDKVDLKNRRIQLEAEDTKDGEARTVILGESLLKILNAIPRAIHDNHVFLYKGKPIKDVRTALKRACEKAGIAYGRAIKGGFTFHDTRHTFNTNQRKSGAVPSVTMKLTGHSSWDMY